MCVIYHYIYVYSSLRFDTHKALSNMCLLIDKSSFQTHLLIYQFFQCSGSEQARLVVKGHFMHRVFMELDTDLTE